MNTKQKQVISTMFPDLAPRLASSEKELLKMIFKGEKGEAGYTPVKGKDYFTDQEIRSIIKLATPIKGKDYFTQSEIDQLKREVTPVKGRDYFEGREGKDGRHGKDGTNGINGIDGRHGRDGSPDSPLAIVNKLNTLKGVLDPSVIDGVATKNEISNLENGMKKVEGRVKLIDMRWHGAGLSQVSHDATLTGNGTASSPLSVSTSVTSGFQAPLTGVVDGSNATYTWAVAPNSIVVDNGRTIRKVSSDGTINWTGTTTTVLAVAPVFDVFSNA